MGCRHIGPTACGLSWAAEWPLLGAASRAGAVEGHTGAPAVFVGAPTVGHSRGAPFWTVHGIPCRGQLWSSWPSRDWLGGPGVAVYGLGM